LRTAVLAVCLFLTASIAAAQTAEEIAWCEGKRSPTADQRIHGCTATINSGKFQGKTLGVAYRLRADAEFYLKNDMDAALRDYDAAIKLDPTEPHLYYERADIYKVKAFNASGPQRKQYIDFAIRDFSENIRLSAKPVPLDYINRSNAYKLDGDFARAIKDLDEAIRLDPSDKKEALVNRCRIYAEMKRWREALADCSDSLARKDQPDQDPDRESDSLVARGLVYLIMHKYSESVADYEAALTYPKLSDYHRTEALAGRGIAKLKTGDVTGGNADLDLAKRLDANVTEDTMRRASE
jgi:tetratricopeptide (TPR) repeat protein